VETAPITRSRSNNDRQGTAQRRSEHDRAGPQRGPDPDDRRAHILTLTAKTQPIIKSIYDLTRKTNDHLQLGISKAEASELHALLRRIRSNLAGCVGEIPSSEPRRTRDLA
jgi:hypothetical protein